MDELQVLQDRWYPLKFTLVQWEQTSQEPVKVAIYFDTIMKSIFVNTITLTYS